MAERNICWISPQRLIAHIPLYVIASADIVNTKRAGPATSFFLEEEKKNVRHKIRLEFSADSASTRADADKCRHTGAYTRSTVECFVGRSCLWLTAFLKLRLRVRGKLTRPNPRENPDPIPEKQPEFESEKLK